MKCRNTFEALILCQLSENRSFQDYLKCGRRYASRQLTELTTVAFRAFLSFYFLHLWVCRTLLKM